MDGREPIVITSLAMRFAKSISLAFTTALIVFILAYFVMKRAQSSNITVNKMTRLSKVDPNSFSEPEEVIHKHIDISWNVNFQTQTLIGEAVYKFTILSKSITSILLDVSEISIKNISIVTAGTRIPVSYEVSNNVPDIGSKLSIELPTATTGDLVVAISYETSPTATALSWLTAEQTHEKKHPFMFSQCQAIHARSILPCQDTPAVKFTYNAVLTYPAELTALMSAIRSENGSGSTKFEQTVPIPSYLIAIAVGGLVSKKLGDISDVWAEPGIVDAAAFEFSETPKMLAAAVEICGPYVWKRYDLLVMPPSFPYGGMENPCLTFVTPTLLAGDKSLADVVAHEISHSWTGNLVTNRNFEHFWLNEGFTVFVEGKIVGRLFNDKERDFHSIRNLNDLEDTIKGQLASTPELTKLIVDLSNLSPDDAFSSVPYVKGATFLRYLENTMGGPSEFGPFLKKYLDNFKYKSIVTQDFQTYFYEYFRDTKHADKLAGIDWDKWLHTEGMPLIIPDFDKSLALKSTEHATIWIKNNLEQIKKSATIQEKLSVHQKIQFLSELVNANDIVDFDRSKVNFLEEAYQLNSTQNSEIRFRFMRLCIRARLMERLPEILVFANSNFRMKFVRPVYRDLGVWPEAKPLAVENFNKYKDQMMKVVTYTIAKDLGITL